jgi:hypothetical protein
VKLTHKGHQMMAKAQVAFRPGELKNSYKKSMGNAVQSI